MKKLAVLGIILLFVLTGCGEQPPAQNTNTDTMTGNPTTSSDFQTAAADNVSTKALTADELKQLLGATDVISAEDTGRTGFGGIKYTVSINDEPAILMMYITFKSKDDMEKNYTQLTEGITDTEALSFTDKGYFDNTKGKLVFITDQVKVDIRYTGPDESFDSALLTKLAESAYTKLTQ